MDWVKLREKTGEGFRKYKYALLILAVFLPDMITFKKKEEEPEDPSSRIDAAEEENKRLKEELEKLREEMAKKEAE